MTLHENLIGGAWDEGIDAVHNLLNPSKPAEVKGTFARGDGASVDAAVDAARAAPPTWAGASPQLRHDVLESAGVANMARKEEIGRLLNREGGKTLAEGIGETVRAVRIFQFLAGEALRLAGGVPPSLCASASK